MPVISAVSCVTVRQLIELFTRIMDEAADLRVTEVAMGVGGEPLLHPRLTDMIKYAKSRGLLVSFNTNANLLFEAKSRDILNSSPDNIIFSVDGASKETYEKIRLRGNYRTVTENIEKFLSLKKNGGLEKPKIKLQTIIMRDTRDEINAVVERWYPLVDEVSVTTVMEYGSIRGLSPLQKNPKSPKIPCFMLWYSLSILWNGDVTICCNDMGGELVIGNIADHSLKELWESDKINEIRRMFRTGELSAIPKCDKCEATNIDLIIKKKALVASVAGIAEGRKITLDTD
jgi:radical SAM protein with 4Fe4S-binding SPASM domain